jgi:hypothetical protein
VFDGGLLLPSPHCFLIALPPPLPPDRHFLLCINYEKGSSSFITMFKLRTSKYRHVFCDAPKPEVRYKNICILPL